MYYLEEFYKERYCGRKPAIFWLVFFSYMCIINMYESVRQVHKMDYTVLDLEMTGLAPKRDKEIEIGYGTERLQIHMERSCVRECQFRKR